MTPDELMNPTTKATEAKVLRTTTLRADTMVVPSNASYTTDSGLLAKAIRRIAATAKRILRRRWSDPHPGAGPVPCGGQTGALDRARLRSRSAAGRDDALAVVRHTTFGAGRPGRDRRHRCRTAAGERETRAAPSTHQGHSPEGEQDGAARRRRGRGPVPSTTPGDLVTATRQITAQTRQRLAGRTPNGATLRVSPHDRRRPAHRQGTARQTGRVRIPPGSNLAVMSALTR